MTTTSKKMYIVREMCKEVRIYRCVQERELSLWRKKNPKLSYGYLHRITTLNQLIIPCFKLLIIIKILNVYTHTNGSRRTKRKVKWMNWSVARLLCTLSEKWCRRVFKSKMFFIHMRARERTPYTQRILKFNT